MEEPVPMLRMYSRCTGETLRKAARERSSGRSSLGLDGGSTGHGS